MSKETGRTKIKRNNVLVSTKKFAELRGQRANRTFVPSPPVPSPHQPPYLYTYKVGTTLCASSLLVVVY